MRKAVNIFWVLVLTILSSPLLAAPANVGLGGMASGLMEPVGLATNFLHGGCYIIGSAFLFASFVRYRQHRQSPTHVTLSTVFFFLIAGLVLIAIPIFTK